MNSGSSNNLSEKLIDYETSPSQSLPPSTENTESKEKVNFYWLCNINISIN